MIISEDSQFQENHIPMKNVVMFPKKKFSKSGIMMI